MKILFSHRTASKDGQAVHIEELIASFRRLDHEVIVVGPANTENKDFGGESRMLSLARKYIPKAILELLEYAYSFFAFKKLESSYLKHQPDVIYERFNLFFMAGVWLKRKYDIPLFLEVNAPIFEERMKYDGIALKRFAKWCQGKAWRSADRVLPVSHALSDYLLSAGVRSEDIAVVPNGIDPARFLCEIDGQASKKALGLHGKVVIGFTGFIREWHGLEQVIDWLGNHDPGSSVQLMLVGDGPARNALQRRAECLGIKERVLFTGLVGRDDIPGVVAAFDIALQSGVTEYASPLKLMEYMALGCAIVAPKQPNIEEILVDGETALLFEPGDNESMQYQIERLCADESLRKRLGFAARRHVIERNLTWDANAKYLEQLFQEALVGRC